MTEVAPSTTSPNWQEPPFNQWAFRHVDQFLPTSRIGRLGTPAQPFVVSERPISKLTVSRLAAGRDTVAEVLTDTETDAFLVLHHGVLIHETYADHMAADSEHLLMSVTKSFVGVVCGILAERGDLDLDGPISKYIPEVIGFGYDGATIRNLLDMRSGIAFSEEYLNPDAEVRILEHAANWRPYRAGIPASTYEFLQHLPADRPHGGGFRYRSCETDILGWVCERASGTDMATLLATLLWQKLGMENDAYIAIDAVGNAVHDGGLNATARDVARFGQLLMDDGRSCTGEQILPPWWTTDVLAGASDGKDAFTATSSLETGMPGGHYRHQLWVPFPDRRVLLALGIHGQMVYIDQTSGTVGVKLSTWPVPQSATRFHDTLSAFEAISAHLASTSADNSRNDDPGLDTPASRLDECGTTYLISGASSCSTANP